MRQLYDGFTVDTFTGAVTYADGHRALWIVLKRGDDQDNDYVLTIVRQKVSLEEAMLIAVREFMSIRMCGSGPCEVVR